MRRAAVTAAIASIAALGLAGGCKGDGFSLQDKMSSLMGDIEGMLGKSSLPGKHLAAIRDVHERESWTFRPEAENALEITRNAVRGLQSCDYATWAESALVVEKISSMGEVHPSSLVRVESLDTLTHIGVWTLKAVVPSEHPAAAIEMIEAMKVMKAARGKTDADAAFTFQVATSVGALASYPFDRVDPPPPGSDNKSLALVYARALHTARGALVSINGRTLDGFQGDAAVREALDRAYTSLCSSVIRLTLMRAALGDSADTARSTAVHDLGQLVPEGGGPVLREVLRYDTYAAVRREAAKSLAAYPRLIAVPALIDGLADEMTDVRSAASRALEAISGETFGDDRAAWLKWWQMSATKTPPSKPAAPEAGK